MLCGKCNTDLSDVSQQMWNMLAMVQEDLDFFGRRAWQKKVHLT